METSVKAMLAVLVISVVTMSFFVGSYFYNLQTQGPTQPKPSPLEGFISFNTVSETEPYGLTANAGASSAYTIWHMKTPGVFPIASKNDISQAVALSVSAATSVGIGTADNQAVSGGYKAFLVLQVYTGTADYSALQTMLDKHPGILVAHQENLDLGTDGYPEILFLVDVTNVPLSKVAGQASPLALTSYQVALDVTIADNNPADIEVAGSNAQSGSGVINWQYTFSSDAEKKAFMIARVYVTMNRTDDYLAAKKLTITSFDGKQWVFNNPVSESRTSTSYDGYYLPASGMNYRWTYNGLLMERSPGSNTYVNIAWGYDYSFPASGSGYATTVTLTLTTVSSASNGGTTADNTDAVIVKNAT